MAGCCRSFARCLRPRMAALAERTGAATGGLCAHSVLECVGHGAAMLTAVRIARPTLGFRTRRLGPNGSLERNVKCGVDRRSKSEEKSRVQLPVWLPDGRRNRA